LRRLQARIEADCARRGVQYPWWIPLYSSLATVCVAIVAVLQRHEFGSAAIVAGGALALAPQVLWLLGGRILPMVVEAALVLAGATVLMVAHPVSPDFAPFLVVISAAEAAATSSVLPAMAVGLVEMGALTAVALNGRLDGGALYVVGVALGLDAGIALRWQMRALLAERAKRELAAEQAVLAERSRLAREVHDVVGHSLSISLLHIGGARRALAEKDLTEVDEALQLAENVARTAMIDLRGSVSRIASGGAGTRPLPDASDIAALVADAQDAGLDVRYTERGEVTALPSAAGVGLYRIAQESLANIAKHAPRSAAVMELGADAGRVTLSVRNGVPVGGVTPVVPGAGLPGMAARADQLGARFSAGWCGDEWVVRVELPVDRPAGPPAGRPAEPVRR
jgi:signal transduction histidine kinase